MMSDKLNYKQLLNYLEFTSYTKSNRKLPEYISKVIKRDKSDFIEYNKNKQGILLRIYRNNQKDKLEYQVHELCKEDFCTAMFYIPKNKSFIVTTPSKRLWNMIQDDVSMWENTEFMILYNLYNVLNSFNPKIICLNEYRK